MFLLVSISERPLQELVLNEFQEIRINVEGNRIVACIGRLLLITIDVFKNSCECRFQENFIFLRQNINLIEQ